MVALIIGLLLAGSPPALDRTPPAKEPAYKTKSPRYGLLALGPDGRDRVWLVLDADTLHVDRNGNGDLTDPGEAVAAEKRPGHDPADDGYTFPVGDLVTNGRTHKGLHVGLDRLKRFADGDLGKRADLKAALAKDPQALGAVVRVDTEVAGVKGGGLGGRVSFMAGPIDRTGVLQFADKPADAPVVHAGGPLRVDFYTEVPTLRVGRTGEFITVVGTPGHGPGTFAMTLWQDTVPEAAKPTATVEYAAKAAGKPLTVASPLTERCCGVNLYGPVQVPANAGPGTATVTLSFPAWAGAKVAPTTHRVEVRPAKVGPKAEAVSPNLVASLGHPDRSGGLWVVRFTPDGERLMAAGSAGMVQTWDAATRRELVRIDTPKGYRGHTAMAAVQTTDGNTLYVAVPKRVISQSERDGKKVSRAEFSGVIRVYDLLTGAEREPIPAAPGTGPEYADRVPGGSLLAVPTSATAERVPGDDGGRPKDFVELIDTRTGARRPFLTGQQDFPMFAPDGRTAAAHRWDFPGKRSDVRVLDTSTGKVLAEVGHADPDRFLQVGPVSPDGAVVPLYLGSYKNGRPWEVWFRDAKTLADRGKLTGPGDPARRWGPQGVFTPDGKRFVLPDLAGPLLVWDVAAGKVARTLPVGDGDPDRTVVSPDGATAALVWVPKAGPAESRNPDPADLPQPRVTLVDLTGTKPVRTLVAPRGYAGGLAFSPDGKSLALGGTGAVHLFDLTKEPGRPPGPADERQAEQGRRQQPEGGRGRHRRHRHV